MRSNDQSTAPGSAAYLRVAFSTDRTVVGWRTTLPSPREVLKLGRSLEAQASIADPRLSREHARVAWDPTSRSYRIGDANSANGTRLNGRVIGTAILRRHDVIRLGDTLFIVEEECGVSPAERVQRAAESGLSVVILGETGTGKELLARRLHDASGCTGPFVPVNCAALPRDLVATELFGHVRGAFSGAKGARLGLFATASQGTLFLDEIGDLALGVQPALLRALEERMIRPVGSDREISTDARVVAATHHDLEDESRTGIFRNDLYARLAQVVLHVPPLRERRSEILALTKSFANRELSISADVAEVMLLWSWPRNIRELKTFVESFCALSDAETLSLNALCEHNTAMVDAWKRQRTDAEPIAAERHVLSRGPALDAPALTALLSDTGGNVTEVAKLLRVSRAKLYRLMDRLGVSPENSRAVTLPEHLGAAQEAAASREDRD